MNNKKAQGTNKLTTAIIVLIILILLFWLFSAVAKDMAEKAQASECRSSVTLANLGKGDIICPTTTKRIDTDNFTLSISAKKIQL